MNGCMRDNIIYLQTWMDYNPSLKENLVIDGCHVVCKIDNKIEYLNIENFYLANMLYNEQFRKSIAIDKEMTATDLFQLMKLYIQTEEISLKEQRELELLPKIKDIRVMQDINGTEFVYLVDSLNKQYRYNTSEPEKIINMYNDLKIKRNFVTLKELGSVIQNAN